MMQEWDFFLQRNAHVILNRVQGSKNQVKYTHCMANRQRQRERKPLKIFLLHSYTKTFKRTAEVNNNTTLTAQCPCPFNHQLSKIF